MAAQDSKSFPVLVAVHANVVGAIVPLTEGEKYVVQVATEASGGATNATIKFLGSASEVAPDFSASASPTNIYGEKLLIDQADQSTVMPGGIVLAGAEAIREFELPVSHTRWFTAVVSGYNHGKITVTVSRKTMASIN